MKKTILLFFLLSFCFSYAQVDRSIGSSQYKNNIKKENKTDYIKSSVELLKKKIELDNLQEAMVKVYIEDSYNKIEGIINSNDLNDVEKRKKIEEIEEEMKKNILEILDDNQKTKYKKLVKK